MRNLHLDEEFASVYGKGAKERLVPIGRRAIGALAIYLRETRPRLDQGRSDAIAFALAAASKLGQS